MRRVVAISLIWIMVTVSVFSDPRLEHIHSLDQRIRRVAAVDVAVEIVGWSALVTAAILAGALDESGADQTPSQLSIGLMIGGWAAVIGGGLHALSLIEPAQERNELRNAIWREQAEAERTFYLVGLRDIFSEREVEAISSHQIFVGMSESAMLESIGSPVSVNRTVTAAGESKQHVYPNGLYVYTESGFVTGWQD